MSIDIRDRIICVSFSSLYSKKEISSCLALTLEHDLNGCLIDLSSLSILEDVEEKPNKIYVSLNFPYYGLGDSYTLSILESLQSKYGKNIIPVISFDKFSISNFNINEVRSFVKSSKSIIKGNLVFCLEIGWVNDEQTYDKICSIAEPYENAKIAVSSFSKKPNKISDVLSIGKRLSLNSACSYDYFGAIPPKKEGIFEILSSGFSNVGVPKHMLSSII